MFFCLFGFYIALNNFSVISRQCLVATRSSMFTVIVLPHWSIMPSHLTWYHTQSHYPDTGSTSPSSTPLIWVPSEEQLVPFLTTLVYHQFWGVQFLVVCMLMHNLVWMGMICMLECLTPPGIAMQIDIFPRTETGFSIGLHVPIPVWNLNLSTTGIK